MKVCKFERMKDEDEMESIIRCVEQEHPYLVTVPALAQLQHWAQSLSVSWFHDEDETSHSILQSLTHYCLSLTNRFIATPKLNSELAESIRRCTDNLHLLVADKADLLIDKIIKAEIYKLSASLLTGCLCERGIRAQMLDTSAFMQINQERKPDIPYIQESLRQFRDENRSVELFVAPLSLCRNVYGEIDFMSTRQNDYYATALASVFRADEVILSTELDNIFANRNGEREQHSLTYQEAENLINSGVHLLYTDCITLASRSRIVLRLTDTHNLTTERLYISNQDTGNGVKAILIQDAVTFVRFTSLNVLPGYLLMGKLLEVVGKYKINVISMASSNVSVSMLLNTSIDTLRLVQRELYKYAEMVVDENMSVIHIIGSLHWEHTQMESNIMDAIRHIPISLISYGGSDHCLTVSVHTKDKNQLIHSLSTRFLGAQSA